MNKTVVSECPNHAGSFDCTPFCRICEGEQEYEYTGFLPCNECYTDVADDVWREELGLCIDCSNKYWSHEDE